MLRGARIKAEWLDTPGPQAIRAQDRERLLASLLEPIEFDDEDRVLAQRLLGERTPEDIALALVHARRAGLPEPEELIENSPEGRRTTRQESHRPGFDEIVWFKMDIGRRQNADPRWILPLLCRRGHITRNEIGAIRIGTDETHFQVPQAIAAKVGAALARTAQAEGGEGSVRIEPSSGPREAARENRKDRRPASHRASPAPSDKRSHRTGRTEGGDPKDQRSERGHKGRKNLRGQHPSRGRRAK
jgi:ATP-dependent RNA helicase DeaD